VVTVTFFLAVQGFPRAPGIAAEILFYREAVKKIGAESPVFAAQPQKGAQNLLLTFHSPHSTLFFSSCQNQKNTV
jgi:hypothetical protein